MSEEIKNCPEEENEKDEIENQTDQIIETGSVIKTKGKHCIHCLTIVGQIEGHYILPPQNKSTKYEHVIPQLVAIEEDPEIEGLIDNLGGLSDAIKCLYSKIEGRQPE